MFHDVGSLVYDWTWRLFNEEVNDVCYCQGINRVMRWVGNVARKAAKRGAYRVSVGKPVENRPL
jgi:hypothetical protein